jgi:hypothetical protein
MLLTLECHNARPLISCTLCGGRCSRSRRGTWSSHKKRPAGRASLVSASRTLYSNTVRVVSPQNVLVVWRLSRWLALCDARGAAQPRVIICGLFAYAVLLTYVTRPGTVAEDDHFNTNLDKVNAVRRVCVWVLMLGFMRGTASVFVVRYLNLRSLSLRPPSPSLTAPFALPPQSIAVHPMTYASCTRGGAVCSPQ